MIYSDIVEYNIVGDTKAALLRCIPSISKVKNGDIISTGQYMNYQNFPNLQFKKKTGKIRKRRIIRRSPPKISRRRRTRKDIFANLK